MMEINLGDIELQRNILKFGYRINYKYVTKISHSFDRFYVVTKFELPKVQDLQLQLHHMTKDVTIWMRQNQKGDIY